MYGLVDHFRAMAKNNAWSNDRLLRACETLSPAEFAAERTSFFPSLVETLNHILIVDWFYLDALVAGGLGRKAYEVAIPHPDVRTLAKAQRETDRQLVSYCDTLDETKLAQIAALDRGPRGILHDPVSAILAHLFVHQIHHRGQVHAMLAGTATKPPQLDEFFLQEDFAPRDRELAALGFSLPAR